MNFGEETREQGVRVSIVIPVYNNQEDLEKTLATVTSQNTKHQYEVIVVDNGSTPPIRANMQRKRTRFLFEPVPGSYAARNAGSKAARGEVLVFLDSGCYPEENWLDAGVQQLSVCENCFVAGKVVVPIGGDPNAVELYQHYTAFNQEEYTRTKNFSGAGNMFIRREVFLGLGGFKSELFSGGDLEFGLRAKRAGITAVYSGCCVVSHPPRRNIRQLWKKSLRVTKGHLMIKAMGYHEMKNKNIWNALVSFGIPPVKAIRKIAKALRRDPHKRTIPARLKVYGVAFVDHYLGTIALLIIATGIYQYKPRL